MYNAAVLDGDGTTTGGQVSGSGFPADGRNVTLDGDEATCGECPGRYLIRGSRHGVIVNGRAMVMEGDSVMCPCGRNKVRASFAGVVFAEKPIERQESAYRTHSEGASDPTDTSLLYDEQLRLISPEHIPLANLFYKVEMENGDVHSGVTDHDGRTKRIRTPNRSKIKSVVLHLDQAEQQ